MVHSWDIRVHDHTHITMGDPAASCKLYSTRATEANYQNIMDGPHLQSGQLDCVEVPQHCHLRGHVQGVLRGIRHLQLHDLPAQLPGKPVPQPGTDAGGAGAAETPSSPLLLPGMAHGRVSLLLL